VQPLQFEEEAVVLPWLSLELKANVEISRFKSLCLQRGQVILSFKARTK
jgi:hypothetical protein